MSDKNLHRKKRAAKRPTEITSPPDFEVIWHCPNCGQSYFGAHPPELCAYCQDYTTWRRIQPHKPQ